MSSKVSIVIPNWNGAKKLANNLPQVLQTKGVEQFVVVDDGSTDDSIRVIREQFPEVELVIRPRNGGFSSSVNSGVRAVKGELVLILNTDAVPQANCLETVLPLFKDEQVFSVGANVGGNWAWAVFDKGWFWHRQGPEPVAKAVHQTLWASGGSAVFRKSMWDKLGGLDELFNPFYEEDLDLGYRATKRGWINLWDPKFEVEHYKQKGVIEENFSKAKVSKVAERNHLIFTWKNITSPKLLADHRVALLKHIIRHPKYFLIFMSALMRFPAILKLRAIEKKAQKVTDEDILGRFNV